MKMAGAGSEKGACLNRVYPITAAGKSRGGGGGGCYGEWESKEGTLRYEPNQFRPP